MKRILQSVFLVLLIASCNSKDLKEKDEGISLSKAMGETPDTGFSKAERVREFIFPVDHGPHPDFRTEWWYFTGNLESDDGRQLGYQFTVFRTAVSSRKRDGTSAWGSNQIYMAHFAVSDISGKRFYFDERFSRDGNELAGAQAEPLRVWLEDWEISGADSALRYELPPLRITARGNEFGIDLSMEATKPYVLQGDSGLSQKGSKKGNASYYYSYTRLNTAGTITLANEEMKVNGNSWMDREWSTSALSEGQRGWDWFALQLDDSTELMYYQMRNNYGTADTFSKGVIVDKNGQSTLLKKDDVTLEVTEYWTSNSGTRYPSGWLLAIPGSGVRLKISPALENQLLDVSVKYWEGAVRVEGSATGKGYVELTGY